MPTIAQSIEREEGAIQDYQNKIDSIDKRLRLGKHNAEERQKLVDERKDLMRIKSKSERVAGKLRKDNRVTMLISVLIMVTGIVTYVTAQTLFQ